MSYIILDLEVSKANAIQTAYLMTPLPVFAAIMAMHALDAELGKKRLPLGVRGVGLVHRNASPWVEHLENKSTKTGATYLDTKAVQQRAGCLFDGVKEPISTPMQPGLLADLSWTLLLDCEKDLNNSALDLIRQQLLNMRLAGGVIKSVRARICDTWVQALGALGRGYWIDDASNLISQHPDPAYRLIAATQEYAWTLPVTLGYSLLENPALKRSGARDAFPHAYAQHLIGLVQLRSVRAMCTSEKPPTAADLWRYGWVQNEFIVSNRQELQLCAALPIEGMHE